MAEQSSRANSASVGSSLARLGVKARRYLRQRGGLDREQHEEVVLEQRRDDRALGELEADGDGSAAEALAQLCRPRPRWPPGGARGRALALLGARDPQANVVFLVGPVDADEGGERRMLASCMAILLDLGSGRDMQSRAQRRQYGEPVERLSLSVRYGQRHTRGRETELVSITCSALQIRRRWVHVPLRSSRVARAVKTERSTHTAVAADERVGRFAPSRARR